MAFQYLEAMEDDARCNFQFDQTGGSGRCPYMTPVGANDVQGMIQDILGYTNPTADSGGLRYRLDRTIPRTHPKCPYLYAQRVSSVVGKGTRLATRVAPTQPGNPSIGSRPMADYLQYSQYELMVEFASRPYPLVPNDAITASYTGKWFARDGSANTFTYSPEWARYCDYDLTPTDNTVQGHQGGFCLHSVTAIGSKTAFNNPPWMWLPDQYLKVRWYQVPYRFITSNNSYIVPTEGRNWRGRINQNPWWKWPAGSLLYMGYSVTKYTPPTLEVGSTPSFVPTSSSPTNTGTILNYERLCDVELTFLLTTRTIGSTSLGATVTNKNYVQKGHNLLPNLADSKFYYATRTPPLGTESVQNPPAWFSFPLEAMFTDPDVAGGPSTSGDN
jgi:hypothetical protein